MVRGGELMVIIRAQDYASRTIHKVTGELAGMQRMQRMQARAQKSVSTAIASASDTAKGCCVC